MIKLYRDIFILIIFFSLNYAQAGIPPTIDMTVRNIKTTNSLGNETGDTLTFEVWLRWTNYGISDRFEFAAAQYAWTCNKELLGSIPYVKFDLLPGSVANPMPAAYRPPTFNVDSSTSPPGLIYLKGSGNQPNSGLPAYIVSANAPYGSKILTFRLVKGGGQDFPLVPFNLRFKLGASPNTFVAYFLPITIPDTEAAPPQLAVALMDTIVNHYIVENPNIILGSYKIKVNLTALFEGKYDNTHNILTKRENVILFLRNSVAPFSIADSAVGTMDSLNFSALFTFQNAPSGQYYIVVKNNQCIETWSKSGGEHLNKNDSAYNYNFTTASSQAYFNNLRLKGPKYCLYSGDVDQNGFINLNDLLSIYNDAYSFVYGNVINDLTGDNIVDLYDMLIASSNMNSFIRVRSP